MIWGYLALSFVFPSENIHIIFSAPRETISAESLDLDGLNRAIRPAFKALVTFHHRPSISPCYIDSHRADPFAVQAVEIEIDASLLVNPWLDEVYDT